MPGGREITVSTSYLAKAGDTTNPWYDEEAELDLPGKESPNPTAIPDDPTHEGEPLLPQTPNRSVTRAADRLLEETARYQGTEGSQELPYLTPSPAPQQQLGQQPLQPASSQPSPQLQAQQPLLQSYVRLVPLQLPPGFFMNDGQPVPPCGIVPLSPSPASQVPAMYYPYCPYGTAIYVSNPPSLLATPSAQPFLPKELSLDPLDASEAVCKFWKKRFRNYLRRSGANDWVEEDKLGLLHNNMDLKVFNLIEDCETYDAALEKLDRLYISTKNELYLRHTPIQVRQQGTEDVKAFAVNIQTCAKDCNWQQRTAAEIEQDFMVIAFITGLASPVIRQRLFEEDGGTLTFQQALAKALTMERAYRDSAGYVPHTSSKLVAAAKAGSDDEVGEHEASASVKKTIPKGGSHRSGGTCTPVPTCTHCGPLGHINSDKNCWARGRRCLKCGIAGHLAQGCRSQRTMKKTAAIGEENVRKLTISAIEAKLGNPQHCLAESAVELKINGFPVVALLDTEASASYLHPKLV